jgi:branched-chain amino acid transport system ATP-binding protein
VARAGVQLVPDDRRILAGLTVAENLLLGGNGATGERPPLSISEVVTLFPLLDRLLDRRGNQLSGGEQQLVAIARAMIGHPSVLLMDEPSEGLAPRIVEQVGEAIAKLQMRDDLTILLAEQNARFALGVAESVAVLDGGRVVFSGSRAAFGADPDLERRYLTV